MSENTMAFWDASEPMTRRVLEHIGADESVLGESRAAFEALIDEMPYTDQPHHTMYASALSVFQWLAVYRVLREKGVDVHTLGAAILEQDFPGMTGPLPEPVREHLRRDAEASQAGAADNEFVFSFRDAGDASGRAYEIDIERCAVCHAYGRHDAMDLVPYMCATDDRVSETGDQGLRRTGTIGLGAHRCDFRYEIGGEPKPLAEQYPDKIRQGGGGGA